MTDQTETENRVKETTEIETEFATHEMIDAIGTEDDATKATQSGNHL